MNTSRGHTMKRPNVHAWAIVHFILETAPFLLLYLWAVKDGWYPSEKVLAKHPDPADAFYAFNQSLAFVCGILSLLAILIPTGLLLLGPRRPWMWTAMLVVIALSIPYDPLIGILVLILWLKESNKAYYAHA